MLETIGNRNSPKTTLVFIYRKFTARDWCLVATQNQHLKRNDDAKFFFECLGFLIGFAVYIWVRLALRCKESIIWIDAKNLLRTFMFEPKGEYNWPRVSWKIWLFSSSYQSWLKLYQDLSAKRFFELKQDASFQLSQIQMCNTMSTL